MERVVARETPADQRCPYCHDALASSEDLPADDLVECDGCRTRHHRACIEELGRCTIRGCERSLRVEPRAEPAVEGSRRSAVQREVERRLRERVRGFLHAHARAAGAAGGRAEVEAAHEAARAAERAGDLVAAAEAWKEVARCLTLARPEELRGLALAGLSAWSLRASVGAQDVALLAEAVVRHAEELEARVRWGHTWRVFGRVALAALALVFLIAVTLGEEQALAAGLALVGVLTIGLALAAMAHGLLKGKR